MNIYVSNINFTTLDESLFNLFATYGEVASAKIITDRETGRSRGFGFVEMNDENNGQKAIDALNGTEFEGKTLNVSSQTKGRTSTTQLLRKQPTRLRKPYKLREQKKLRQKKQQQIRQRTTKLWIRPLQRLRQRQSILKPYETKASTGGTDSDNRGGSQATIQ